MAAGSKLHPESSFVRDMERRRSHSSPRDMLLLKPTSGWDDLNITFGLCGFFQHSTGILPFDLKEKLPSISSSVLSNGMQIDSGYDLEYL